MDDKEHYRHGNAQLAYYEELHALVYKGERIDNKDPEFVLIYRAKHEVE